MFTITEIAHANRTWKVIVGIAELIYSSGDLFFTLSPSTVEMLDQTTIGQNFLRLWDATGKILDIKTISESAINNSFPLLLSFAKAWEQLKEENSNLEDHQAMLSIATTAASMAFGIGELRLAIQGSKYIKAGIAGTLLIKGVNDFLLKNELYKDEITELLGRNFVSNYEAFSSIIDIVLLSKQIVTGELEEKVNALATAWGKIDEHNLNQLKEKYSALYELINSEIEKIKSL